MAVGTADLSQSLKRAWYEWGVDDVFRSYWTPGDKDSYPSLHDTEATPGQPFPYCVFEVMEETYRTRMSDSGIGKKRVVKDVPVQLRIYTKPVNTMSAKELAAVLLETVMSKFGGHPTDVPQTWDFMDNGCVLSVIIDYDYGMRAGDEEYVWNIQYLFRCDVPARF